MFRAQTRAGRLTARTLLALPLVGRVVHLPADPLISSVALAALSFSLVDSGRVRGVLGATTITTVFYLATRGVGVAEAQAHVRSLLDLFDVASVDRAVLVAALDAGFDDFEDGVLHEAAVVAGVDAIVTRDGVGFSSASLPVFSPSAFLAAVRGHLR